MTNDVAKLGQHVLVDKPSLADLYTKEDTKAIVPCLSPKQNFQQPTVFHSSNPP